MYAVCFDEYDAGTVAKPWDDFGSCAEEKSYCQENPNTIMKYCRKTCGVCGGGAETDGQDAASIDMCITTDGDECVFPFEYKGNFYDKCTGVGHDGVLWCSLDAHHDGRWGNCNVKSSCAAGDHRSIRRSLRVWVLCILHNSSTLLCLPLPLLPYVTLHPTPHRIAVHFAPSKSQERVVTSEIGTICRPLQPNVSLARRRYLL